MKGKTLYCRRCHRLFSFQPREQQLFKELGFQDPIRCPECRAAVRQKRADPYDGWQSTMGFTGSRKHRHTRVAYPPHIVGGFR